MGFNILALLCTMGCCLISIIVAGTSASKKNNKEWFESLNHPDNAFLAKYMNIVGIGFYLLFGYVLYHLFVVNDIVSIIITVFIILLMGLCPLLLDLFDNPLFTPWIFKINNTADKRHS